MGAFIVTTFHVYLSYLLFLLFLPSLIQMISLFSLIISTIIFFQLFRLQNFLAHYCLGYKCFKTLAKNIEMIKEYMSYSLKRKKKSVSGGTRTTIHLRRRSRARYRLSYDGQLQYGETIATSCILTNAKVATWGLSSG